MSRSRLITVCPPSVFVPPMTFDVRFGCCKKKVQDNPCMYAPMRAPSMSNCGHANFLHAHSCLVLPCVHTCMDLLKLLFG